MVTSKISYRIKDNAPCSICHTAKPVKIERTMIDYKCERNIDIKTYINAPFCRNCLNKRSFNSKLKWIGPCMFLLYKASPLFILIGLAIFLFAMTRHYLWCKKMEDWYYEYTDPEY